MPRAPKRGREELDSPFAVGQSSKHTPVDSPALRMLERSNRRFSLTSTDVAHIPELRLDTKIGKGRRVNPQSIMQEPPKDADGIDEVLASVCSEAASLLAAKNGRQKGRGEVARKASLPKAGSSYSNKEKSGVASPDRLLCSIQVPKPLLGPSELQQVHLVAVSRALTEVRNNLQSASSQASPIYPTINGSLSSSSSISFLTQQSPASPTGMASSRPIHRKVADLIHHIHSNILGSADDWWTHENQICVVAVNANGGEVIGLCVASQVEAAARVATEQTSTSPAAEIITPSLPTDQFQLSKDQQCSNTEAAFVDVSLDADWPSQPIALSDVWCKGCLCGVNLVWTHPTWAHRGIARSLIDCCRTSLVYGWAIPKEMVAFSHPTADGKALATRYSGRKDFLVFV